MIGNLIKKLKELSFVAISVMGIPEKKINLETGFEL